MKKMIASMACCILLFLSLIHIYKRQDTNEKLLYLIDNGKTSEYGISGDDIYNLYTGDGGLHGLRRQDYENYASYSEAKKEIENGQFFTPPLICRLVAEALSPPADAAVADLTCGAGAFFNFMPVENNLYGCEPVSYTHLAG